jgi:protein involved in polysaccharide export with SLBB domain
MRRRTPEAAAAAKAEIRPGDILAIFVNGVIGSRDDLPVIHLPRDRALFPAIGHPFVVQADGAVDLPLIGPVAVGGLKLRDALQAVTKAYTVDHTILQSGRDNVVVSILRKYQGDASADLGR